MAFLSGENKLALPDFKGFRGNPIIIGMLEHIAQSMGRETGGGVLYFRNRIRDALAEESNTFNEITVQWNNDELAAKELLISPFSNDPYLAEKPEYRHTEISIVMSDEVPGSVVGIKVKSEKDELYFTREFELKASGA